MWHLSLEIIEGLRKSVKPFVLLRHEDETGVSGTGIVAEGVTFSDGVTHLRWKRDRACSGIYKSMDDVIAIHGHGGKTEVVYLR